MSHATTLTVPAGTVASTLTGFVTRVDLADLPPAWWADTSSDLGNVRVKQGGAVVPFDIVSYDRGASTGELFFKATLTTGDNVFTVETVDGASALAATDPNGRNAVWSDYSAVVLAAELINRVNGDAPTASEGTVTPSMSGLLAFDTSQRLTFAVPKPATWTAGFSGTHAASSNSNRVALTVNTESTTGDSDREALCIRWPSSSARRWALWNSSDGWLNAAENVVVDQRYRVHATHDGTVERNVWVDGALLLTDLGVAARPGGVGTAFQIAGRNGDGGGQRWNGALGYMYLRDEVLPAEWIAAEYVSWETPETFYVVGDAPPVEPEGALFLSGPVGTLALAGDYTPPAGSAVVEWTWAGAVTPDGFTVTAKVPAGSSVRLAAQAGGALTAPTYGPATVADADGIAKVTIDGLDADTSHIYGLEVDGVLDAHTGRATTFPTPGTPTSFTFAHASCMNTGSNHRVFDAIRGLDPRFFVQLGDLHYRNYNGTSQSTRVGHYDSIFDQDRPRQLWAQVPVPYMWDDHDFCGENSTGSATGKAVAQAAYRQAVPAYDMPATDGALYQWFQVGRVAFILTDLRSNRASNSATDNASKSMLGAEQKAWFKQTLLDADAAGAALIVWVSTNIYSGHGTTGVNYDNDQWAAFATERNELANFIRDNGLAEKLFVISGDAHMVAHDDGTNTDFATGGGAGFPEFVASALDRPGIQRGAHWSSGAYPGGGQYGRFAFTDDGEFISWEWQGVDVDASTGEETTLIGVSGSVPEMPEPDVPGGPSMLLSIAGDQLLDDLSGFPVLVDLADLPSGWWDFGSADGGTVRVQTLDGTDLPFDLVDYDPETQTGRLFFSADLIAGVEVVNEFVVAQVAGATAPAASDPIGREAVWAAGDYPFDVMVAGTAAINRVDGAALTQVGTVGAVGGLLDFPGGGNGHFTLDGLPRRSAYTFGASVIPDVISGDQHFAAVGPIGTTNSVVATIAVSTTPNPDAFALWNSSNGWLAAGVAAAAGARRQAVCAYVSGTSRTLYLEGAQVATSAASARPGGTGDVGFYFGAGVNGSGNTLNGRADFAFLVDGAASPAWIAALNRSWESGTFYTVSVADTGGALNLVAPVGSLQLQGAYFGPVIGRLSLTGRVGSLALTGAYTPPVDAVGTLTLTAPDHAYALELYGDYDPPIAEPPAVYTPTVRYDLAMAYPTPDFEEA